MMTIEEMDVTPANTSQRVTTDDSAEAVDAIWKRALTGERLALAGLFFILFVGAYFRFTGLNWDANHHLHPDERFLTSVAAGLEPVSDPLTYLQTSESTLNPYNLGNVPLYVYGNFPMTVLVYAARWANQLCQILPLGCTYNFTNYDGIHILGRFLSGLVDLVSIFFVFLIGRSLYDWRAGLLGALFLSIAVMPIQQSHFFTMDNWAAALSTVTLYMAVRAAENARRKRWWLLFGLFLGLAVASRINVAPLAATAGVAGLVWLGRRERAVAPGMGWRYINTPRGSADLQYVALGVLLAAFISLVTFRLAQPYAFADAAIVRETVLQETGREPSAVRVVLQSSVGFNPRWTANMQEIQGLQSPDASFPPALQWTDRAPILFPLSNMVLYGMGLSAGIAACLGLLWAAWRTLRARPDWTAHAILVAWAAGYFLFMGTRWVKSIRYFLPVYPAFLLLGAWLLVEIWRRAEADRLRRALAAVLIILTMVPSFLWARSFVRGVYQQPMTRIAASRWMLDNIPSGATLHYTNEDGEHALQLPLKEFQFEPGGLPLNLSFTLPETGRVEDIQFNYLTLRDGQPGTIRLTLLDQDGQMLQELETQIGVPGERQPATVDLSSLTLEAERRYLLRAEHAGGGAVYAATSRIVNEEWDDLLPVSVDGKAAYGAYLSEVSGGQRPLPWPANEEKRQLMLQWIDEADVIALSSQRSLWNTPRLPLTYPLNIAYYQALFRGELGFELVAEFHADLHVGPLYISDTGGEIAWGRPPEIGWPPPGELAAEEAFSVYDHPPVWIFRKSTDYDPQRVRQILEAIDLDAVVNMTPGQATSIPNGLMLSSREQALQQENGTFVDVFNANGILAQRPWLAAVVWWAATVLLGWFAVPLAYVALPGLPDRGYVLARILALLFVSWLAWFVTSYDLLLHNQLTLFLSVLVLLGLSTGLLFTRRSAFMAFIRRHLPYITFVELLGLLLFAFFILIRLGNPDVWDVIYGGEKPMDLSYFTAVMKSSTFPPYDPWYAGGYINYYYYGFVFAGVLPELLGMTPTIAYNLALCMLYSFTGLGVFSLAYNLVAHLRQHASNGNLQSPVSSLRSVISSRPILAGLAATVLAVFLGNLGQVGLLLNAWQRASTSSINTGIGLLDATVRIVDGMLRVTVGGQQTPLPVGDWFWTATRAINTNPGEVAPITEFPFFTFLYGDLHAHMIALPLTILALGWAVSLVLFAHRQRDEATGGAVAGTVLWFAGALAIGVLRPTNTWDWPTYTLFGALATFYYAFVRDGKRLSLPFLARAVAQVAVLVLLSSLLFWPFISNYGAGYESLRLWDGSYTYVGNYLVVYGLFLFLIATHLAREWRLWTASWSTAKLQALRPRMPLILLGLAFFVVLIAILLLLRYYVAPIVLTLAVVAGLLALRPQLPPARRILLVLIAAGLALTLMVEIVVLEGDIGRMNTVFKFYMQVWILFSVVGGAALSLAWPTIQRKSQPVRRTWKLVLALLVACALLYPLLAIPARWNVRMSDAAPTTLDGMAFMQTTSYQDAAFDGSSKTVTLDGEYEALRWMQQNIAGSPVIVEAAPPDVGEAYRSIASRVAMYTGLPTVIGWDWHQTQQRAALTNNMIRRRMDDVARLYNTADTTEAMAILRDYDVSYVYVGTQEALYYQPDGLEKFSVMAGAGQLREVFRNDDVTIYEVIG